jgi:[CysO sulfur-carrier protein]-S-L-cysteine hydrolase
VLTIDSAIVDAIVAHARRDHPDEACGVVAGPAGSDLPTRHVAMDNAARSMTFYEFDSMEQLRVWREMDDNDEEPVVIYHSHTATEAYPSRTDVSFAGEPGAHYLLVSTRDPDSEEIRSFRIVDGVVTEEEVNIVDATVTRDGNGGAVVHVRAVPGVGLLRVLLTTLRTRLPEYIRLVF